MYYTYNLFINKSLQLTIYQLTEVKDDFKICLYFSYLMGRPVWTILYFDTND